MALDRVTSKELTYPGDGLHYRDEQPFTGVMEFRSRDGTLQAEEEFKDGLLWGRKRTWHPSGGLELDAECAWGGYHGRVREWYEDGRLAADMVYEYAVRVHGTRWDEEGRVVEEFVLREGDPGYKILEAARVAFGGQGEEAEPAELDGRQRDV
jgi:antitoxin component YwqK of YwqJK toxin-antitoxin module